jgi:hypothetical protein
VAWIALTAALALVGVGYVLGRTRPYVWLGDWTNWQLRFHLNRWVSRPRQIALFTLLLLTDTRRALHAWRHRKDPEPERAPAMTFRALPDHTVDEEG